MSATLSNSFCFILFFYFNLTYKYIEREIVRNTTWKNYSNKQIRCSQESDTQLRV